MSEVGTSIRFTDAPEYKPESREYEIGTAVRFVNFAGRVCSPYPVLAR